jgi:hypothetical protein
VYPAEIKRISRDDIGNGEVIERLVDCAGQKCTALLKYGYEVATVPTEQEKEMLCWWETEGRKMWQEGRKRKAK